MLLLLSHHLNAQIELPKPNLYGCDYIVLPAIEGIGLSDNLYYYEGALSDESIYYPGDTIYSSTQLFAYDEVNGWEECTVLHIIENMPILNMPDTAWYCNIGNLPKPIGEFITINASYFKSNEYLNPPLHPGAAIEENGWYYLRDGHENCYVYDSIFISISPPVFIDDIGDTLVCQEYIIPDFSSTTNATVFSFVDNLGNVYNTGDKIIETTYLTFTSANNACSFTRSFRVTVFDGVFPVFRDTVLCERGQSIVPFLDNFYLDGFNNSITTISNGNFSSTYIIDYNLGGGNCSLQDTFTVIQGSIRNFPRCFPDTSRLCNIGEINLYQYVKHFHGSFSYELEFYLENGDQISNIINTQDLIEDTLDIYFHTLTIPECFDSTHIFKSTFIITDDCKLKELSDTLYCARPGNFTKESEIQNPYGTKLYDKNFELASFTQDIEFGLNIFYNIIKLADGTRDTATHHILMYEYIEVYPSKSDHGTLCYQDCITIDFVNLNPHDTSKTFAFWNIELYSKTDTQYIESFFIINEFLSICFDEINQGIPENTRYLQLENHDYYLIFYAVFVEGNFCIVNNEPDTVYVSTLYNTSRYINDILCPDEEFIFNQDTFNIDNPYKEVIIENASSNGCDSLIIVDLEFDISSSRNIQENYCDTSQFLFVGCELFDYNHPSGIVKIENASSNGCDSIVNVNLTFTTSFILNHTTTFCDGDTLYHNGIPIYENVIFSDTLTSNSGCDSIITENVYLVIDKEEGITFDILFDCANQSYTIHFLESYPILLIGEQSITDNSISGITQDEILISYGQGNNCLTQETIKLDYPSQWNISINNYEDLSKSEEIILEFESGLVSPTISWYPSDILSCDNCATPTLLNNQDTMIVLQLTDEFGCSKEQIITITFLDENYCYVPNVISRSAFLPENQRFSVTTNEAIKYDLFIFDRWGSQIFKAKNMMSDDSQSGWKPTRNFEIGVYAYLIKFHDLDKKEMLGTVLLLD